jgi:hypothetical protein
VAPALFWLQVGGAEHAISSSTSDLELIGGEFKIFER